MTGWNIGDKVVMPDDRVGEIIKTANGSRFEYFATAADRNYPVYTVLTLDGEVLRFGGDALSADESPREARG